jgi:hypothetical protein
LTIWDDVPEGHPTNPYPYSHPNDIIWKYKAYEWDEVLVGYDKHPHNPDPDRPGYEPVFLYSVELPTDAWFLQDANDGVYWFSVVAVYDDQIPDPNWGWTNHRHVRHPDANDDAVAGYIDNSDLWIWEELHDQTEASEDMSFRLFTEPDCFNRAAPEYADWVALGKPDCWCYPRNCRGDADGKIEYGTYWVLLQDLNLFKTYFGATGISGKPGICCDFARDIEYGTYRVLLNDLNIFKTYFGALPAAVPICD